MFAIIKILKIRLVGGLECTITLWIAYPILANMSVYLLYLISERNMESGINKWLRGLLKLSMFSSVMLLFSLAITFLTFGSTYQLVLLTIYLYRIISFGSIILFFIFAIKLLLLREEETHEKEKLVSGD